VPIVLERKLNYDSRSFLTTIKCDESHVIIIQIVRINNCAKKVFITHTLPTDYLWVSKIENISCFPIMHIVPVHFVLIETYDFIYVFFLLTGEKKRKVKKKRKTKNQ